MAFDSLALVYLGMEWLSSDRIICVSFWITLKAPPVKNIQTNLYDAFMKNFELKFTFNVNKPAFPKEIDTSIYNSNISLFSPGIDL